VNGPFHVQGRLVRRRGSQVIHDETRRADTESRDEALQVAAVLCGDGFTVWVWAVDTRSVPADWQLVERVEPPRCGAAGPTGGAQALRRDAAQRSRPGAA
jgi:hypothetical protein